MGELSGSTAIARKWRLHRAAFYGLIWQVLASLPSGRWQTIAAYLKSGNLEMVSVALIELCVMPVVFVLVAAIRNRIVVGRPFRSKRPAPSSDPKGDGF